MSRQKALAVSLIAILGAAIGSATTALWKSTKATDKEHQGPNDRDDLKILKSSIGLLQTQVVAMDRRVRATERTGAPSTVPPEGNGSDEAQSAAFDPAPSAREVTEVEIVAGLDEKFTTQEVDPAWSRTATSEATRVLSGHLPRNSTLTNVECRKDMCRIESRHPNIEEYQEFASHSFRSRDSGLWNGGHSSWIVEKTSNGGVVAVSHLAREGQDLPNIELADN
jgi:hypothetical protein